MQLMIGAPDNQPTVMGDSVKRESQRGIIKPLFLIGGQVT